MPDLSVITLFVLTLLSVAVVWLLILVLHRQAGGGQFGRLNESVESLKADMFSKQMEGLVALRNSFDEANKSINQRLAESNTSLDHRLKVFGEIESKLGQLEQQTHSIEQIGQNIQSLSELLKPPRVRGVLGEMLLENLLSTILPQSLFSMQYNLAPGCRVDAVVRLGDKLLPIDSKFPLESFRRLIADDKPDKSLKQFRQAFKKQIDAIHDKYLLPEQNTTEFAMMYIPSETIYYQLVSDKDQTLFEHALSQRVIPSSPGHLYAFLASIAAVHSEAVLGGDTARLNAAVNNLSESLSRLLRLHERMEGSSRSMGLSLSRVRDELSGMTNQLDRLRQPIESTDKNQST